MSHCCSPSSAPHAAQFDGKRAARDLATYRRSGPDRTTRGLLHGLAATGIRPRTVLDIGAGIGVLSFELLETGVASATCVDMSPAFIEGGQTEAQRRGLAERMAWRAADFVSIAPSLPPADVVIMNRVVCCYPAFEALLRQAAEHAQILLALSYPRDCWYVRLQFGARNVLRKVKGNAFRAFVHPAAAMEALLVGAGFQRVTGSKTVAWQMDVFQRADS